MCITIVKISGWWFFTFMNNTELYFSKMNYNCSGSVSRHKWNGDSSYKLFFLIINFSFVSKNQTWFQSGFYQHGLEVMLNCWLTSGSSYAFFLLFLKSISRLKFKVSHVYRTGNLVPSLIFKNIKSGSSSFIRFVSSSNSMLPHSSYFPNIG